MSTHTDAGQRIALNAALLRLFKGEYRDPGDRHSDALFVQAALESTHTDAEFEQVKAELSAAPSDNELSRLRCDAERLREIAGMLEPPFDETTICDRVRNELTALRARCERAEKALVRVLRAIDSYEEASGQAVIYGEDRKLLEMANTPCSRCDPSFSCWTGQSLCRKQALAVAGEGEKT
jgi:hypothetical protein